MEETSTELRPAARHYGRRADAERNRERVLDHAARLLSDDPATGMAEIAVASKISRGTLYRHFPTREGLIEAITARALDDVERAIVASRLDEGTAAEALRRLIAAFLEVGDRYRFLLTQDTMRPSGEHVTEEAERLGVPLFALFERGQVSGEFSRGFSPIWMATVLGAVLVTLVHEIAIGRLAQNEALMMATNTLLNGLLNRGFQGSPGVEPAVGSTDSESREESGSLAPKPSDHRVR